MDRTLRRGNSVLKGINSKRHRKCLDKVYENSTVLYERAGSNSWECKIYEKTSVAIATLLAEYELYLLLCMLYQVLF